MLLLAIPPGLLIGFVIGAVGGGGAILALPAFVYVLGEHVGPAAAGSLVVAALAATAAGATMARDGQVCWRVAVGIAGAAAVGAPLGALANQAVAGSLLLLAFVPVMLAAAHATWRRTRVVEAPAAAGAGGAAGLSELAACPHARLVQLGAAGFGVGVLTGFFGVGGGFVIVPLLTLWLGMGMRRAVASSLVIVALTAVVALASHLAAGTRPDGAATAALAAAAVLGALGGAALGRRLPSAALGRGFAAVVAGLALLLLVDVLALGGPPGA